jgi:hypothetical protein
LGEPTYRWVCTYCDASGVTESSEMARLAIDVHVSVQHPQALDPEGGGGEDDGPGSSRAGSSG